MLDRIVTGLALLGGVLLCALALLICANVFGRFTGLYNIGITTDAIEYLIYFITFFAAPWVLREGGHITVDLLIQSLPRRAANRLLRAAYFAGAAICALCTYYGGRAVWESFDRGTRIYRSLIFEEWPVLLPLPIVFFLLLLIFLRWIVRPASAPGTRSEGL